LPPAAATNALAHVKGIRGRAFPQFAMLAFRSGFLL
jgi:hypothetical protein